MRTSILFLLGLGCSTGDPAPAMTERQRQQDYWKLRSDAELDEAFEASCAAARADGRPLLLTFSADWCPDCKRVYALSQEPPLKEELSHWHHLVIHPGRFDRHEPVLAAFEVSKIVTWVATRPDDCRLPAPSWTRMRQGTFEPASGEPRSGEALSAWLAEARTR